jgi:hypothetical protein
VRADEKLTAFATGNGGLKAGLKRRVPAPTVLLKLLSVLLVSERKPTAVLNVPVVRLKRAA